MGDEVEIVEMQCQRCEGNGRLWADGKAHFHSDTRPTMACGDCGGTGRDLERENESIRQQIKDRDLITAEIMEALRFLVSEVGRWTKLEHRYIPICVRKALALTIKSPDSKTKSGGEG